MKILVNIVSNLLLVVTVLTFSNSAHALERFGRQTSTDSLVPVSSTFTPLPLQLSQSDNIRSRSDVMREVKQRYNAEVLRIKLNKERMVYEVRVLMPNGKVKNITVSARR